MIVLDASAAIEWLLQTPVAAKIDARVAGEALHAPHLIDLEVAQVLRRFAVSGLIAAARGEAALQDLIQLPITRYPHDPLLPRIWALRDNMTAYDAAYVALAEALDAALITRDAKMAGAGVHRAQVELL